MKICKKIVIVGLGLIGGSLGIALKRKKIASEIVGVSRKPSTLRAAKKIKAVDWATDDLRQAVKNADIVVLATPINTIINFAGKLKKMVAKDCIVSDVGSTKAKIVRAFEAKGINFVGAHPLAGSEKRGVKSAEGTLFKNSLCILTPTARTRKASLAKIEKLWKAAGVKVAKLSPGKHDLILAQVSHLPHVLAFSLARMLPQGFVKFVAPSFKDVTRIAASDPEVWTDVFSSNKKFLLDDINKFQKQLQQFKALIKGDKKKLFRVLRQTQSKRIKI